MASAAPGGTPPPPDPGNGNNGNTPVNELDALLESASDINIGLTGFSRFLSCKNSVELHKNRARGFLPYRSLPSVLAEFEVSQNGSSVSSSLKDLMKDEDSASGSSQSSQGRNFHHVNWADLHSSQAQQILVHNPGHASLPRNSSLTLMEKSIQAAEAALREASSVGQLSPKETESDLAVLHAPTNSRPFVTDKSAVDIEMVGKVLVDAHHAAKRQRENNPDPSSWNQDKFTPSGEKLVQLLPDEMRMEIDAEVGQSPNDPIRDLGDDVVKENRHINLDDGLLKFYLQKQESPESLYFSPASENPFLHAEALSKPPYPGLPLSQISQIVSDPDPISVYYQETFMLPPTPDQPIDGDVNAQAEVNQAEAEPPPASTDDFKYSPYYHDFDDDLDLDKKPDLIMKGPDDLPLPDPAYVASTVHESLIPLIAKVYKKDCRTWLWKSKTQREAALKQQAEDEVNGIIREMPRRNVPIHSSQSHRDVGKRLEGLDIGSSYYS